MIEQGLANKPKNFILLVGYDGILLQSGSKMSRAIRREDIVSVEQLEEVEESTWPVVIYKQGEEYYCFAVENYGLGTLLELLNDDPIYHVPFKNPFYSEPPSILSPLRWSSTTGDEE